jgi:hypothetical protein
VLLYGGGAVVALWLTSVVVGAINSVPLVRVQCCLLVVLYSTVQYILVQLFNLDLSPNLLRI